MTSNTSTLEDAIVLEQLRHNISRVRTHNQKKDDPQQRGDPQESVRRRRDGPLLVSVSTSLIESNPSSPTAWL